MSRTTAVVIERLNPNLAVGLGLKHYGFVFAFDVAIADGDSITGQEHRSSQKQRTAGWRSFVAQEGSSRLLAPGYGMALPAVRG